MQERSFIRRGIHTEGSEAGLSLVPLPLMHFIFNLFAHNTDFTGLNMPGGVRLAASAYADDLLLFCGDLQDIEVVLSFFQKVEVATDSRLNKAKTKSLSLSRSHINVSSLAQYLVPEFKICGVFFSCRGYNNVVDYNMTSLIQKITKKLPKYPLLEVSLPGKVLLRNSCIHPLITYFAAVYLPSKGQFAHIEKEIFVFLWDGKTEMVARKSVMTSLEGGGHGLESLI